jgi:hypothetical protein
MLATKCGSPRRETERQRDSWLSTAGQMHRTRFLYHGVSVGNNTTAGFLFVRDFSTSAASLNGLAPMGVEDACARDTRVATKAYDLWIATGNPDATYNWYRAVRRTGLHVPGVQPFF